ncbi:MAG: transporter [Archangium gephyra]|uniref:Transporter n=1 Tax=Archangium gephyra TaxID=48 RepID=A0A2W5TKN3_9BACT|nr:MAG: transporter [Archangium gephyra]
MSLLIVLAALGFLMWVAYRGNSVILFAPVAALGAVLLSAPLDVAPAFSALFLERMAEFLKSYFAVFLLGALFGKLIELSGFAQAIVQAVLKLLGPSRAIPAVVLVCALLTYGGVSLFVVVFAVYPFAFELFRRTDIPRRLLPGTIALGAFTFTMDSLPGTPQIQNVIPTTFFGTTTWAAPVLGTIGAVFILISGLAYLSWRRRQAGSEGFGELPKDVVAVPEATTKIHWAIALLPLVVVGVSNFVLTNVIKRTYGESWKLSFSTQTVDVKKWAAIWAVEAALLLGIATVVLFAFKRLRASFTDGSKAAVQGAMLASMNTASEYGFGAIIAALPGFLVISDALKKIPSPLIGEAVSVTTLAGITGSASGGMGLALGAMATTFIEQAKAANIPMEVLHRVASMASGGMDTLPHNGAVITLLAVTGLTHKQSYRDIFAITLIKTAAVFVVIAVYSTTGLT